MSVMLHIINTPADNGVEVLAVLHYLEYRPNYDKDTFNGKV
jgi:hypothetical protein